MVHSSLKSVVLVSTFFLGASVAQAQLTGNVQPSVSVSGSCLKAVQPDRGSITLTADSQSLDLKTATKKSTESYDRLKQAIQKLNLKDVEITTSEYTFQEVREWEKDRSVFKGFRARMGMSISTSEIARLGEVISIASKEGIRDVGALNAYLSPEKLKTEREGCLEEAVKNARSKAETLAKAASTKIGSVLGIQETGGGLEARSPMPMRQMMMKGMAADVAAEASPSIDAGPQRISIEVSVVFALK